MRPAAAWSTSARYSQELFIIFDIRITLNSDYIYGLIGSEQKFSVYLQCIL